MAQKVITQLVDDLSGDVIGERAGRTVQFAFDGSSYEIDLSDENAAGLRGAFADYIGAARKTTGRSTRTTTSNRADGHSNSDDLARIRGWAAANGHVVAPRGRISRRVRNADDAAH